MAREFYLADIKLWPPPWNREAPLGRALSYLWFLLILPVVVITTVLLIPILLVSKLMGGNAPVNRSHTEVAEFIDDFVNDTGQLDFGQFLHFAIENPELDAVRLRCAALPKEYPPDEEGYWCSAEAMDELGRIADELRQHDD